MTVRTIAIYPGRFQPMGKHHYKTYQWACQKYGAESCAARFLSMSACTYMFAINQGKHPDESLDIADELFVLNPNHFMIICDMIIERKYDFNIWDYSRIDT